MSQGKETSQGCAEHGMGNFNPSCPECQLEDKLAQIIKEAVREAKEEERWLRTG